MARAEEMENGEVSMSKKDYQAIARAIFDARERAEARPLHVDSDEGPWRCEEATDTLGDVAFNIADVFATDNPRFDRARFIQACETGSCKEVPR